MERKHIMKMLLVILGIIAIVGGVFGFITLSNAGISGDIFDFSYKFTNELGLTSAMGTIDQVKLFLVNNRTILTIAGAVMFLVGLALRRRA
jgi:hypothetical protein